MNDMVCHRLIRLEGARNVRDLGGYPAGEGKETARGVFLRADHMGGLTPGDIRTLKGAGVTLSIDLRSPAETKMCPSKLADCEGVRYENVAMFDGVHSAAFHGVMPASMSEMYIGFLDHCRERYRTIFQLLAENPGAALFHCTAGKDRTGVLAMLLLKLAGVPDSAVVADYAESERLLGKGFRSGTKLPEGMKIPIYIFQSRAEEMEKTLAHLRGEYGDAYQYLRGCGLDRQLLDGVTRRFLRDMKGAETA